MSKRRSTILQVAREAGALWRMNGAARGYLAEEAPGLYRVLEELAETTKEEPNAHPHGGMPLDSEA